MENKFEYLLVINSQRFHYKIICTEKRIGLPAFARILIVGDSFDEIQRKLLKLLNSFTFEIEDDFNDITKPEETKLYINEMKGFVKQAIKETKSGKYGFEFSSDNDNQILECNPIYYDITL